MMFDFRNLGGARQELVEMPAPASRVQLVPIPSRHPIKHLLDAPAQPRRGFGFFSPDRFKNGQYVGQLHVPHHDPTNLGISVLCQCISPLLSVLGVAPASLVRGNVRPSRLLECHVLGEGRAKGACRRPRFFTTLDQ